MTKCKQTTWAQIEQLTQTITQHIKKDNYTPDTIIGISRGGIIPARLLSDKLCNPNLTTLKIEHWGKPGKITQKARITQKINTNIKNKKILIVDDLTDTGDTLQKAITHTKTLGATQIKTATLHHKTTSNITPDYYGKKLSKWTWIIYPWMQHEDACEFVKKAITQGIKQNQLQTYLKKEHNLNINQQELNQIINETKMKK
jgi:hypoxanthine phosphoribosyltransferase